MGSGKSVVNLIHLDRERSLEGNFLIYFIRYKFFPEEVHSKVCSWHCNTAIFKCSNIQIFGYKYSIFWSQYSYSVMLQETNIFDICIW